MILYKIIALIIFFSSFIFGVDSIDNNISENIQVINQLGIYKGLLTDSLSFIAIGIALIYIVQRLVSKYLYTLIKSTKVIRIIKVIFGTLYTLILVISVLLVLKKLGFEVEGISKLSILRTAR